MFELVTAIALDPLTDRSRGRAQIPILPWLADHFPKTPIAPATLLLELAAQIAGPLAESVSNGTTYRLMGAETPVLRENGTTYGAVLGMVRSAVFRAVVELPAEVEIDAAVTRREASSVVTRVEVRAAGVVAATAELVFAMVAVEGESAAWREREARVERWRAAWRER